MRTVRLKDLGVTVYATCRDTTGRLSSLADCLERIRCDEKLAEKVLRLRELYSSQCAEGIAHYDREKKQLPAVTLSGTFTHRAKQGLATYSGVIQVDLDDLKVRGVDPDELRRRVAQDPHVLFAFLSPSGDGLKCGVLVGCDPEDHENAFRAVQRYWLHTHGLAPDEKCRDVSRLCFLSSDPHLIVNEHAQPLDWQSWPQSSMSGSAEEDEDEDDVGGLPLDALPEIVQRLATANHEVYQVDVVLPAVTALTILAASMGKMVTCKGATNGRSTPCNLFTVISAPSGYGKGVVGIVAKPLIMASAELAKQFEEQGRPELKVDISIAEMEKKTIMAQLKAGKLTPEEKCEARDRLTRIEADIERWSFAADQLPALYTGSATGAALGVALRRNDEQLLSVALEAGDAIRVAAGRYTADSKGDYDLILSAFSGEPYADARISRVSLRLEAPCLNILWAVQPSLCRELYSTIEAQERGLLARINVVQCDDDITPLDDGVFREVPQKLQQEWDSLIRSALDHRRSGRKVVFSANGEAAEVFRRFHNRAVELRNGPGRESEAKLKRCRENAIRIATVIAATEWLENGAEEDFPLLTAKHAAKGVALAQYFLNATLSLTRGAVLEKQQARLEEVLAWVAQSGGSITLRRLRDHHGVGSAELEQIVARSSERLKIVTIPSGAKGGRPSPRLISQSA